LRPQAGQARRLALCLPGRNPSHRPWSPLRKDWSASARSPVALRRQMALQAASNLISAEAADVLEDHGTGMIVHAEALVGVVVSYDQRAQTRVS